MPGEVLVAIMNNALDFATARDRHWYRIPQSAVSKFLSGRWPPRWLAFYQTKAFGPEAYTVKHYARVQQIDTVQRWQLFPEQPRDERSEWPYYQLHLGPLHRRRQPIISRRQRRIVFIPTTLARFRSAKEINDLYAGSPLEDRLWGELKAAGIDAERQEFVEVTHDRYSLDFAVYCSQGQLDIETDGDTWHANPSRAASDNVRDNSLEAAGWTILRFSTSQIMEEMREYCLPLIARTVNRLGGLETEVVARRIEWVPGMGVQKGLFDPDLW